MIFPRAAFPDNDLPEVICFDDVFITVDELRLFADDFVAEAIFSTGRFFATTLLFAGFTLFAGALLRVADLLVGRRAEDLLFFAGTRPAFFATARGFVADFFETAFLAGFLATAFLARLAIAEYSLTLNWRPYSGRPFATQRVLKAILAKWKMPARALSRSQD